jgi:hypothetical protein
MIVRIFVNGHPTANDVKEVHSAHLFDNLNHFFDPPELYFVAFQLFLKLCNLLKIRTWIRMIRDLRS